MYNFTLTWHKSYIIRAGKKCNNIFTIACNSSSVNVSISFHADRISSIIVLYGSPFQIHKLRIKNHELKFSTEPICYIDFGDECLRNVLVTNLFTTKLSQTLSHQHHCHRIDFVLGLESVCEFSYWWFWRWILIRFSPIDIICFHAFSCSKFEPLFSRIFGKFIHA